MMADKDNASDASSLGTLMPMPWMLVVVVSILGMFGVPLGRQSPEKPGGGTRSASADKENSEAAIKPAANRLEAWKNEPVWKVLSEAFGDQIFAPDHLEGFAPLQDVLPDLDPPLLDELCFSRVVSRLKQARQRLGNQGEDSNAPQGLFLEALIATLADPIESHYPLLFDEGMEAIQQGFQSQGFAMVGQSLPWSTRSARRNSHKPGVLLFRRAGDSGCHPELGNLRPEYILLFVVGESPTSGIDRESLQTAVSWCEALFKANEAYWAALKGGPSCLPESARSPIRIIGPTFSGSVPGLARFVADHQACIQKKGVKRFTICSGSATAGSNQCEFAGIDATYSTTVANDKQVLGALLHHLKERRGFKVEQIAIVTEQASGYAQEVFSNQALTKSQETEGHLLVLTYPLSLSQMRTELERESDELPMGLPASPPTRRRNHDVTERVSRYARDVIPVYSHAATGLADRQLESLIRVLKDRDIRAVGLMGTNFADKVFLAQQLRREFTDVQFFTLENHLLYTHSEYSRILQGMLIGASYPLNPDVQSDESCTSSPRQFTSDSAEGTYHATRKLLGCANVETPEGWLCVVGNDRIWPLEKIPATNKVESCPPANESPCSTEEVCPVDAKDPQCPEVTVDPGPIHSRFDTWFPTLATSVYALCAMGAGIWWCYRRPSSRHWKPQTQWVNSIQIVGLLGMLAAGGHVFVLSYKLQTGSDLHRSLGRMNLVLLTWWAASIALTFLLIWQCVFIHVRSVIRLSRTSGSLPWFHLKLGQKGQIKSELRGVWSACRSVFGRLLPSIAGWVVLALVLVIWFEWCAVFLGEYGKTKLSWTAFRASDLYNQVNPAVPVLFLAGALHVWALTVKRQGILRSAWTKCERYFTQSNPNFQQLVDERLSAARIWWEALPPFGDSTERHSGSESLRRDSVPHTAEEAELGSIRRLLTREILDGLCDLGLPCNSRYWISGIIFVLLALYCFGNSMRTLEGTLYDITMVGLFGIVWCLTWMMIIKLKWSSQELLCSLRTISRSALHHAIDQIDPRLRTKVSQGILCEGPDAAELQMVRGLLPESIDNSLQATAIDFLEHSAMATALGSTDAVLETQHKTLEDTRLKNKHREQFVFSLITIRIREVFWQIRNLATATVIILMLQFFAMVSYPFQTNGGLRYLWIAFFLWACYVLFRAIVDFNRNQTLSELSNTTPDKLTYDHTLFVPLVQYLLIPMALILNFATPVMGHALFQWTVGLKGLLTVLGGG
jgi:hypothetical protein